MNRLGIGCLCAFLFAARGGNIAGAENAGPGGLCFRFDDNQTPAVWRKMADVFERNGARFCAALNTHSIADNPEYGELLRRLSSAGHELLDHTPDHMMYGIRARSAEELERYRKEPAVHHVDPERRIAYLRYEVNLEFWANRVFRGSIRGNELYDISDGMERFLHRGSMIYLPLAGEIYGVAEKKRGKLKLVSFWNEDVVSLPEMKHLELLLMNASAISPTDDGMRLLAREARADFRKLGVEPAKVWIRPIGWEPAVAAEVLFRIYGREFHYCAADCPTLGRKWSCIFSDTASRAAFSMRTNSATLERKSVAEMKTLIADSIAGHRVLMMAGRMNARHLPGGFEALLRRHDELLKWIREKKIPVRTVSEWARELYETRLDPRRNVLPSPARDLDGNGSPDGYRLTRGTLARNGMLLLPPGNGEVFAIKELAGLEKEENLFRFSASGQPGTKIVFRFAFHRRGRLYPEKCEPLVFTVAKPGWQTYSAEVNIPRSSIALDLVCLLENAAAPVELKEPSLTAKPRYRRERRDHRRKRAGWTPRREQAQAQPLPQLRPPSIR